MYRAADPTATPVAHWSSTTPSALEPPILVIYRDIPTSVHAQMVAAFVVREFRMRMKEKAMPERLASIVNLCRELDPELAVIQNGDCVDRDMGDGIRALTG